VPPRELEASEVVADGRVAEAPEAGQEPIEPSRVTVAEMSEIGEGPGSDQPVWSEPDDFEDDRPLLGEDEEERAGEAGAAAVVAESATGDGPLVQVPSFLGMTLGEAIRAARMAGVELAPEGSGQAVAQSPSPGPRPRGAICRVSFRPGG
jgi:hypothetical protein